MMRSNNLSSNNAETEEKQTVYNIDTKESLSDLTEYLLIRHNDDGSIASIEKADDRSAGRVIDTSSQPDPKWHWGAFFFPYYWTFKHGLAAVGQLFIVIFLIRLALTHLYTNTTASVLAHLCTLGLLAIAGYCGLKGYQQGWMSQHYPNGIHSYYASQTAWTKWGFIINVPLCLLLLGNTVVGSISSSRQPNQAQSSVRIDQTQASKQTVPQAASSSYYNYPAPVVYQHTESSSTTSRSLN